MFDDISEIMKKLAKKKTTVCSTYTHIKYTHTYNCTHITCTLHDIMATDTQKFIYDFQVKQTIYIMLKKNPKKKKQGRAYRLFRIFNIFLSYFP
jgi:hypothetical protein